MRRMLTHVKGSFTEEELLHLRTIYNGYYAADPTDRIQPYDGMAETLQELHKKGIQLAVLSNKPHAWTTFIIEKRLEASCFTAAMDNAKKFPKSLRRMGRSILRKRWVLLLDSVFISETPIRI